MTERAQVLIEAVDRATDVLDKIERKFGTTTAMVDKLKYALGTLGGVLSVGAFASMIEGTIQAEAELHKLAQRTGESVEMLSALRGIAKQSGTDMDAVAGMTQKLSKNLFEFANTGGGKAAQAFQALGFSQAQAREALQDMDKFLPEFAKKLVETGTGSEQVAMAMMLMGKSGANALPFLHQLAAAGALNAKVTTEQAQAAHDYEVNMTKLAASANTLKLSIANALLPALKEITAAMVEGRKEAGLYGMAFEGLKAYWAQVFGFNTAGQLDSVNQKIIALTEKIAGLQDVQSKGGHVGNRLATLNAELAALSAKRDKLEQIQQIETPGAVFVNGTKAEHKALASALEDGGGAPGGKAPPGWTERDQEIFNAAKAASKELEQRAKDQERATEQQRIAQEKLNDSLSKQAEAWENTLDPLLQYEKQIAQISNLVNSGFLSEEKGEAAFAVVNERIRKATQGVQEVATKTNDIGRELGLTFTSAFENAVIRGNSFRDVLTGIDQDIARIILRKSITEPAGKAISDGISSSGIGNWFSNLFGGARAGGGAVNAGNAYLVGENGPELMVPGSSGTVVPNGALGGDTLNVTLNVGSLDPKTAANVIMANMGLIQSGIASAFRRAGRATVLG